LRELAREGALAVGVPIEHGGKGGTLLDTTELVASVAAVNVSKALVLASQRLLIEAMLQAQNIAIRDQHLPALMAGDIGGGCAASWPLQTRVPPLAARDAGRGWRMSGRLANMPNLDAAWFLLTLPVSFDDGRSYSLVLLRSEEDGLRIHNASPEGSALELTNVFLREDEILSTDGPAAVAHLAAWSAALQAAVAAGTRRGAAGSSDGGSSSNAPAQFADSTAAPACVRMSRTVRHPVDIGHLNRPCAAWDYSE
jgi:alkylation response protein AidB-like acyl-CoA dehydrogenase